MTKRDFFKIFVPTKPCRTRRFAAFLTAFLCFALSTAAVRAETLRVGKAVYETESGVLSFGDLRTTVNSDSAELSADGSLLLRGAFEKTQDAGTLPSGVSGDLAVWPDASGSWLKFRWIFSATEDGATVANLKTPTFEYAAAADELKALGTAGLTAVDEHAGSYMFLALARPVERTGVVAAWTTSDRGSGIVFSAKSSDENAAKTAFFGREEYGKLRLEAGKPTLGEIFVVGTFADVRDGLELYADAVAAQYGVRLKKQPVGYCTWYSDRNGGAGDPVSNAEFARDAATKLVPWGFNLFQIDSRWQDGKNARPTDGEPKIFARPNPNGPYRGEMKNVANELNRNGLVAGLWILPFAASTSDPYFDDKADLYALSAIDYDAVAKNRPGELRLSQKKGAPYEAYWGGSCLDMTNPKALDYAETLIRQATQDWGYQYLKIDGLWTGAACQILYVNDEYRPDDIGTQIFADENATNVEAYRRGSRVVRDAAGDDVFILGCNVSQNMRTLGASYGFVDAMRIGPDNGAGWGFRDGQLCVGPVRGTPRYFYNGRVWWNDPDPVYVRNSIPVEHARAITSWTAISGQLYLFSDWLPALSEERVEILRRTAAPHGRKTVRPIDLLENAPANGWILSDAATEKTPRRDTLAFFNWSDEKDLAIAYSLDYAGLDAGKTYSAWDFWADAPLDDFAGKIELNVAPASCRVLSVRETLARPFLISTNRHVAGPLFEVAAEDWNAEKRTLSGTSRVVLNDRYELRIVVPDGFDAADVSAFAELAAENASGATVSAPVVKREGRILRVSFAANPGADFASEPTATATVSDETNAARFNVDVRWRIKFND